MKYTHLYTGPDGKSHFKDIEIPMKSERTGRLGSDAMKATSIFSGKRAQAMIRTGTMRLVGSF